MNRIAALMALVLLLGSACQPTNKFIAVEIEDTETASHQPESDSESSVNDSTSADTESDTGSDSASETHVTDTTDTADTTDTQTADSDSGVSSDDTQVDTGTETGSESDTSSDTDSESDTDSCTDCGVPDVFAWQSTPAIITPAEGYWAIKDPTVVFFDEKWHIYATTTAPSDGPEGVDWGLTYLSFSDWDDVEAGTRTSVGVDNPDLDGYNASPQLFYFSEEGRELWYLVYQTQAPKYSTSTDPTDVTLWTAPTPLMSMPDFFAPPDTYGLDYWVICDDADCFLFFTALDGILYRARTTRADFPNGFEGTTEIALQDDTFGIDQGCSVYTIRDNDSTTYLLIGVAFNAEGNRRFFRAWTTDTLGSGDWTELSMTEDNAFASFLNVTQAGEPWSLDGFHQGEILRANPDETMTINTVNMRFLYQGLVSETTPDIANVYSLGLLTDNR